eukprot:Phypoly_transcript_08678.p1 GENE.Phypoly_transcript_08678~~Phypoly_transcript_08678.p1  ORF type:complete len:430 (+),score=42.89 Phypoly_transcript_08678:29-1291(+)
MSSSSYSLVIGCVGKPSAGKSSFLNAATDANAKVGSYPFTTIEPNYGVTLFQTDCPCAKYNKSDVCAPRYGKCVAGVRHIPVKMLDVAGLVPGASEGKGLGNQFLDDLRQADVLLHVIDVSGMTNEKGEETSGYDPINDIEWLQTEIHSWIFNNLWKKWTNIVRRHCATKSSAANTLQLQLSGYGTRLVQVQKTLDSLDIKEPSEMETWDEKRVHEIVDAFLTIRFPTILILNKVDMAQSDVNIAKICKKYPQHTLIPTSALAECFLKKLRSQNFILYADGGDTILAQEDGGEAANLKPLDDKMKKRLENVKDLVLFRYGSTGVRNAITSAVETKKFMPVYPVRNLNTFCCDGNEGVFRDCMLVPEGTTVGELAAKLHPDLEKHFLYAESVDGMRLGEDHVLTPQTKIIKITAAVGAYTG